MCRSRFTDDHRDPKRSGSGSQRQLVMPQARAEQRELLPVESEVRGMQVSEARRLRAPEEESRQLKDVVAELTLNERALKAMLAKKY